MRNTTVVLLILLGVYYAFEQVPTVTEPSSVQAVVQWQTGQQIQGSGTVLRVLSDDNDGSRHQRFILELDAGRTLLIAHNIDLAPRIASLGVGDTVSFYGQYESNEQGGVIHWTHRDPQGHHVAGWLEHNDRRYQ